MNVRDRVLYLDGWRGLAIISVLFGHFVTTKGVNFGRFGVELFFVLSGRLMAEILFVRKTALSDFFPRRISRVYPALLFTATMVFAIFAYSGAGDPTWQQYLAVVTFTANYAHVYIGRSMNLDHIWSLCVEEHMYILLGVIALVCRRFTRLSAMLICTILALGFIANGFYRVGLGPDLSAQYWRTDVRGASILIGVIAYLWLHDGVPKKLAHPYTPVLCMVLSVALNVSSVPDPIKYSLGTAFLGLSIMTLAQAPRWLLRILESRVFLAFGLWSYSLYLWQQPFYRAGPSWKEHAYLLPCAIVIGLLCYKFVEQPTRIWINNRLHARKARIAG
jgi:peptidoglycan/LPS O-acetylase OafA/YrhL